MEVVGGDGARLQLEKDKPAVGRRLRLNIVVDLNQSHILREFSMCCQDHAIAIVQKVIELSGVQDMGDGPVGDGIGEVIADRGNYEIFPRVSGHCRLVKSYRVMDRHDRRRDHETIPTQALVRSVL